MELLLDGPFKGHEQILVSMPPLENEIHYLHIKTWHFQKFCFQECHYRTNVIQRLFMYKLILFWSKKLNQTTSWSSETVSNSFPQTLSPITTCPQTEMRSLIGNATHWEHTAYPDDFTCVWNTTDWSFTTPGLPDPKEERQTDIEREILPQKKSITLCVLFVVC